MGDQGGHLDLGTAGQGIWNTICVLFCPASCRECQGKKHKNHADEHWCYQQNFGGFDRGSVYMRESSLATNRVHLSQRGKRILALDLQGFLSKLYTRPGRIVA